MTSQDIAVAIGRPAADVAAFAREPGNLPAWAAGLADGDGCRVVFTLSRRPGMTDEEYAADATAVAADLARLRQVLEG